MIGVIFLDSETSVPVWVKRVVKKKNGSSDGSTVNAHNFNPSIQLFMYLSGNKISIAIKNNSIIKSEFFLIFIRILLIVKYNKKIGKICILFLT